MSLFQVLVLSRYLPTLTGAAAFRLSKSNVEFSNLGRIWPFIYIPIITALLYKNSNELPHEFNSIKNILLTVSFWLKYLLAIYSVIRDGFYQRRIIDVARAIENWDKRTGYGKDALTKRENKNIRFWIIVHSFVLVIFTVIRSISLENLYAKIGNEMVLVHIDTSIQMFAVFATLLGMRFRYLNSIIEQHRGIEVQSSCCPSVSNPEYVRTLYTSLVATAGKLNDHYSSRLLWWSAQAMAAFIVGLYNLAIDKITVTQLAVTVPRLVAVLVGLFVFTAACQFTVDQLLHWSVAHFSWSMYTCPLYTWDPSNVIQASQTSTTLLTKNIRLTDRIDRGRKEIFTMSLYMTLKPFTFSALGFFSVDLTSACAVCTVTITYLALCIQTGTGS